MEKARQPGSDEASNFLSRTQFLLVYSNQMARYRAALANEACPQTREIMSESSGRLNLNILRPLRKCASGFSSFLMICQHVEGRSCSESLLRYNLSSIFYTQHNSSWLWKNVLYRQDSDVLLSTWKLKKYAYEFDPRLDLSNLCIKRQFLAILAFKKFFWEYHLVIDWQVMAKAKLR